MGLCGSSEQSPPVDGGAGVEVVHFQSAVLVAARTVLMDDSNPQAGFLELGDDLASDVPLRCVRFDNRECALGRHGVYSGGM